MDLHQNIQEQKERVFTISIERANFVALLLIIPESLLLAFPFFLIWGTNVFTALRFRSFLFLSLFIVLGAAVHELLHGIAWIITTDKGFRSLHFGVKWQYLTPYCHSKESMKVWQYVTGALTPLVIMGILPSLWAMYTGNALVMFFGIFFTWAAGGDIQAAWMLRKFNRNQVVHDHPEELGFILMDN
jgi:hypothetical protein